MMNQSLIGGQPMLKTFSVMVLALAALLATAGCDERRESQPQAAAPSAAPPAPAPAGFAQPAPVVVQAAPQYVEEGATVNGVVVVQQPVTDGYVLVNGGWYYWHPTLQVWVHAQRPAEWHPQPDARVYHAWAEHPKFRH
jgi:hypothetical protein